MKKYFEKKKLRCFWTISKRKLKIMSLARHFFVSYRERNKGYYLNSIDRLHAQKILLRRVIFLIFSSRLACLTNFFKHRFDTMVASAVFITDLQGKAIISRNYRGDVDLNKAIERFATYLVEVDDEAKKPVFHVDTNGDVQAGEDVGATGTGGEHYVYVSVSTESTTSPF